MVWKSFSYRAFSGIDRDHAPNLGDMLTQVPLDSHLQGDVGGRAADTGTEQADSHDAVGIERHELDVAAIGFDSGADQVEYFDDALLNGIVGERRGNTRRAGGLGSAGCS
jgi:hypothetical protein